MRDSMRGVMAAMLLTAVSNPDFAPYGSLPRVAGRQRPRRRRKKDRTTNRIAAESRKRNRR